MYIYQAKGWPNFVWNTNEVLPLLGKVRHRQGLLFGQMNSLGFSLKENAVLDTLALDVTKSSEIEGEVLNLEQVRSSIARRLGIDIGTVTPAGRDVEGVVEMLLDATQRYGEQLTAERLFGWHAALFPTGRSGMYKITVGNWRTGEAGPMQVVSGPIGREKVHFEASDANLLKRETDSFLNWINNDNTNDPVIKAAIAHLWFVTIHPFDDGNGRIGRAVMDLLLARADDSTYRFYSVSAQILRERQEYYKQLEVTQRSSLDITPWITWFLNCMYRSMSYSEELLAGVVKRNEFWAKYKETDLNERQRKVLVVLLDNFFGKLTSSKWAKMAKTSQDTATRDLQDLVAKGILVKEPGGGRSTSYTLV
ncbi:Fic family protein [Mucilaginibacter pedocola]|uniref:Cell filamentation protein Fic n=1 Tax=Mucilaginibacter pedocola TaxID=1792845 RepID=A0A1S9P8A6_9SPHI|nr:Fic family protein [Mucilaginibacter pedocola]OOQ57191.1 cell filamentation protein Fic [Mucilaginibacter pedocola]